MEFVSARELKVNTGATWEKLEKEKELIITLNGKPIALMTDISGKNLEVILAAVRRARGEWAVREIQRQSVEKGTDQMPDEEIENEVRQVRRKLRRS